MASRKEGTGSAATSSSSTTGPAGKGKGKGGSGDSAVKQVQIDGLVSGVPFPQAHVGSSFLIPVPPDALLGSLPLSLLRVGQGFPLKPFFFIFTFCWEAQQLSLPPIGGVEAEIGNRGSGCV